jgi:hypothetical protein
MTVRAMRSRDGRIHPVPSAPDGPVLARRRPCGARVDLGDVLSLSLSWRGSSGVNLRLVCEPCLRLVDADLAVDLSLLRGKRASQSSPLSWSGAGDTGVTVEERARFTFEEIARGVPITNPADVGHAHRPAVERWLGCFGMTLADCGGSSFSVPRVHYGVPTGSKLNDPDKPGLLTDARDGGRAMEPKVKPSADQRRAMARGTGRGMVSGQWASREGRVLRDTTGRHTEGVEPLLRVSELADAKVISRAVYAERTPTPSRTFGAWSGKPITSGSVTEDREALRAKDDARSEAAARWLGVSYEKADLRRPGPGFGQTAKLMATSPKKEWIDVGNERPRED